MTHVSELGLKKLVTVIGYLCTEEVGYATLYSEVFYLPSVPISKAVNLSFIRRRE